MRYHQWQENPVLFEAVLAILYGYDPIGICFAANPNRETEYAAEASTILPRLADASSAADVRRVVYEEFVRWFDDSAKSMERYNLIAADVWQLLRKPAHPTD